MAVLLKISVCPCEIPDGVRSFWCVELGRTMHTSWVPRCRIDLAFREYWRNAPTGEERLRIVQAARAKCPDLKPAAERLAKETGDPSILSKIAHYSVAFIRWMAAGCPVRSPDEVARIYAEHCGPCDSRDPEADACRLCGCNVKKRGMAVRNKAAMRTEHCRKGKW